MSTRERWTVYPLLFLTLGIALTDKITRSISTDRIECKTLLVTDQRGEPRVIAVPTADGGVVETRSTSSGVNVIVGQTGTMAGLMFSDAQGRLLPRYVIPLPPKSRGESDKNRPDRESSDSQDATGPEEPAGQDASKVPAPRDDAGQRPVGDTPPTDPETDK